MVSGEWWSGPFAIGHSPFALFATTAHHDPGRARHSGGYRPADRRVCLRPPRPDPAWAIRRPRPAPGAARLFSVPDGGRSGRDGAGLARGRSGLRPDDRRARLRGHARRAHRRPAEPHPGAGAPSPVPGGGARRRQQARAPRLGAGGPGARSPCRRHQPDHRRYPGRGFRRAAPQDHRRGSRHRPGPPRAGHGGPGRPAAAALRRLGRSAQGLRHPRPCTGPVAGPRLAPYHRRSRRPRRGRPRGAGGGAARHRAWAAGRARTARPRHGSWQTSTRRPICS